MLGHRTYTKMIKNLFNRGVETLRQPDRNPRCYELTDEERLERIREWSEEELAEDESEQHGYYGA